MPTDGCGTPANPLACANLNLPYYGSGKDGWHLNIGWLTDRPIVTLLVLAVVLTIAKSVSKRMIEGS